ncbi:PDK [Symbiodinium sp. CCMP2592]|nr:PDK [Symbiodinium sp. CCMP2592]
MWPKLRPAAALLRASQWELLRTRLRPGSASRRWLCSAAAPVKISKERLHEFLQAEVVFFAGLEPKSITLRQILDAKTPKQAAKLAYRELPIRYAQRILQIEGLPGWEAAPELVEVHRLYSENFKDIRLVDLDMEDLEPFTSVIETIKGRMKEVIPMLAARLIFIGLKNRIKGSGLQGATGARLRIHSPLKFRTPRH